LGEGATVGDGYGASMLNGDLNQGTTGHKMYLCFETSFVNPSPNPTFITDLKLVEKECPHGFDKLQAETQSIDGRNGLDGVDTTQVSTTGLTSELNGDLNQGTNGKAIYLCYKTKTKATCSTLKHCGASQGQNATQSGDMLLPDMSKAATLCSTMECSGELDSAICCTGGSANVANVANVTPATIALNPTIPNDIKPADYTTVPAAQLPLVADVKPRPRQLEPDFRHLMGPSLFSLERSSDQHVPRVRTPASAAIPNNIFMMKHTLAAARSLVNVVPSEPYRGWVVLANPINTQIELQPLGVTHPTMAVAEAETDMRAQVANTATGEQESTHISTEEEESGPRDLGEGAEGSDFQSESTSNDTASNNPNSTSQARFKFQYKYKYGPRHEPATKGAAADSKEALVPTSSSPECQALNGMVAHECTTSHSWPGYSCVEQSCKSAGCTCNAVKMASCSQFGANVKCTTGSTTIDCGGDKTRAVVEGACRAGARGLL